jgi:hypothetical protein
MVDRIRAAYPPCPVTRLPLGAAAASLALALAGSASGQPGMVIGAAEDLAKTHSFVDAKAEFEIAAAAGMNAIRITALWRPATPPDLSLYETTAAAAALTGIRVYLSVYPESNRQVPLDDAARADFVTYTATIARLIPGIRDYIIGNEPNLNYFWLPQYNPDGSSASPEAYVRLLAATYDALKALDPAITVVGGSVSPAGTDKPKGKRPTHSPGKFILGMGKAYRLLGRSSPIMDAFAFHPYMARSRISPFSRNPKSTRIALSDYDKLTRFLGRAFDGTPQAGSALPIVYDEFGVQTVVPKVKRTYYTYLRHPVAADAVAEKTQAAYYRDALRIATCQPTVSAFLFFHTVDEPDLRRWQSGLFYADRTPKSSFAAVRDAIMQARAGTLTTCPVEAARRSR